MSITFVNIISGVCVPGPDPGWLVVVAGGGEGQRVPDVEERGGDRVQEPRQHQLQPRRRRLGLRRRQPGRELAPASPHHGANLLVSTAGLKGRIYFELQGVPQLSIPFVLVVFSASRARTEEYFTIFQQPRRCRFQNSPYFPPYLKN